MGFCCNGLGWGGWPGLLLNVVLFGSALTMFGLGAVWFTRLLRRRSPTPGSDTDPLAIARRQMAAGEITVEDFEGIRDRLQ